MENTESVQTSAQEKRLIVIPFSGFYESSHDSMIDQEIESLFQDDCGNVHDMPDDFWYNYNGAEIRKAYAKDYTENFQDWLENECGIKIKLEFESLQSPREYNFTTDRIFCYISKEDIAGLFQIADTEKLESIIKEEFTSRDGFSSSYSNLLLDWLEKPLMEWDHNELATLLRAAIETKGNPKMDDYELMEHSSCNGVISSLVWDNLPDECKKLADAWWDKYRPDGDFIKQKEQV